MSIEELISRKSVSDFLEKNGWQPVEVITHGATSDILVIERDSEKYALKIAREKAKEIVLREHRLLKYLNTIEPEANVPGVEEWLEEISGFMMEYLLYPSSEVRQSETWAMQLARALCTVHGTKVPDIEGIPDDRPDIRLTVTRRLADQCSIVHNGDDYWKSLPEGYRPALEVVRRHYDTYIALMPDIEKALADARPALTHGDLAGDNIMLRPDGTPVFADWGEVRISSGLLDLACLFTFTDWSEEKAERFLAEYCGSREMLEKISPHVRVLRTFYRYLTCVNCLWWLIQPEEEKLDTVGRAFFEKVLAEL